MRRALYYIILVALIGVICYSGYQIGSYLMESHKTKSEFDEIVERVTTKEPEGETVAVTDQDDGTVIEYLPVEAYIEDGSVLPEYKELAEENPDLVGWIKIGGTKVNYPVMHTPSEPQYYLRKNFKKQYSLAGTPFLQGNCEIGVSDNLIIYGHHMKDGQMFGGFESYKKKDYYEEHKYVRFDTLTHRGVYKIFCVFKTTVYDEVGYKYYEYTGGDEEDYNEYLKNIHSLQLYDTGITAEYGDELLTLSTCEYSAENGRLVLVCKKIW